MKRIISIILSLCMILAAVPVIQVSAITADESLQYLTYEIVDGEAAITGCEYGVTEIVIPDTIEGCPVTKIAVSAFSDVHTLQEITIPVSLKVIEPYAFSMCYNIRDVYYGASRVEWNQIQIADEENYCLLNGDIHYAVEHTHSVVTTPAVEATETEFGFTDRKVCSACGDVILNAEVIPPTGDKRYSELSYKLDGEDICATGTIVQTEDVVIPYGVTRIAGGDWFSSFYNDSYIASVSMPESLLSIEEYSFRSCSNLNSVIIPDSVTEIGEYSFEFCFSLVYAKLSDSMTRVEYGLFEGCNAMRYVHLPENVEVIDNAFYNCESLTAIEIPHSVKEISEGAFWDCDNLRTVYYNGTEEEWNNIPGHEIFEDKTVYLSDTHQHTVVNIPASAPTCTNVGYAKDTQKCSVCGIYLDEELALIAPTGHLFTFGDCEGCGRDAEEYCLDYFSYNIVDGEVIITSVASGVTSLAIPAYIEGCPVTRIEDGAFMFNTVKNLTIPETIKKIGWIFGSSNITTIYYKGSKIEWNKIEFSEESYVFDSIDVVYEIEHIHNIVDFPAVEPTETEFGRTAEQKCVECGDVFVAAEILPPTGNESYSLLTYACDGGDIVVTDCDDDAEYVVVPEGVKIIGEGAFLGHKLLKKVVLPETIEMIRDSAFEFCTSLTDINLPDSISEIGFAAFSGCDKLIKVVIPKSVEFIRSLSFAGCDSLVELIIPEGVLGIEEDGICCENLINLVLPDTISHLAFTPFSGCNSLTAIKLPNNVEYIGGNLFVGMDIETVYFTGTQEEWENMYMYAGGLENVTVYYADSHIHTEVTLPAKDPTCTEFGYGDGVVKCAECGIYLTEINPIAPKGHTFEDGSCVDCGIDEMLSYLEYEIIEGVARILSCDPRVKEMVIPETIEGCPVTTIYSYAFSQCTELTKLVIPEGVRTIDYAAVSYCENLKEVYLPASLEYIEEDAFGASENIETVYYAGTAEQWDAMYIGFGNDPLHNATLVTDYVAPVVLYGDANGDGAINALDVIATKKYLVGIYDENINENLMDANCDGKINAKDLLAIKKTILGI